MRSRHCAFAAVLLSVSAASAAFAAASLTPLGDLPGGEFRSYASGVSDDGSVVVGSSSYSVYGYTQAFRWTSDGGMVGLGDLPGPALWSSANGVSADGRTIVGFGTRNGNTEAFRWTSEGGMVGLGYPPGPLVDPVSTATGVSGDGSVVVGVGQSDTEHYYNIDAFHWSGGYMGGLGDLPMPFFGRAAEGVSGDGSVVVGTLESSEGYEAFRWTSGGGTVVLDGHPLGGSSGAYGVNADGSVVVGFGNFVSGTQAFRWTNDGGMVGLGFFPGHVYSEARGVSGDGSVVVGISDSDNNVGYGEAFLWTSSGGMERLWDVLVGHGVDPAADGWTTLGYASDISADGRTIVGNGVRNGHAEAFAAFIPLLPDLPGDFNFDGSVDAADYVAWRKSPSSSGGSGGSNTWRSNFGKTFSGTGSGANSNATVPEPATALLILLAVASFSTQRFRCRRRVPKLIAV